MALTTCPPGRGAGPRLNDKGGRLPPFALKHLPASRGLFLHAPAQKAHSEQGRRSEQSQRSGFGHGCESVRTNRVIAAKTDNVGAGNIPLRSSVPGEVAIRPDILRGRQRVSHRIEREEVAVELARPSSARRQVDALVAL